MNNNSIAIDHCYDDSATIPKIHSSHNRSRLSMNRSKANSRNSLSEMSHSDAYERAPRKSNKDHSRASHKSHRFRGPSVNKHNDSNWSQSHISATENHNTIAVDRPIVRSQLSKNDETTVRRGRAARDKLKTVPEDKKNLPDSKYKPDKEGVLSLRLSNIKELDPERLLGHFLVSIDLRNNRLSILPDEISNI